MGKLRQGSTRGSGRSEAGSGSRKKIGPARRELKEAGSEVVVEKRCEPDR